MVNVEQFTGLLKNTKPDQVVTIDFRRKNEPAGVAQISLGTNKDRDYGFLGVAVLDAPWAPFSVDFNLANVGGPSAGLMFSLAVVDKLTPASWPARRLSRGPELFRPTAGRPDRWHHAQDGRPPTRPVPRCSWCPQRIATRRPRTIRTACAWSRSRPSTKRWTRYTRSNKEVRHRAVSPRFCVLRCVQL